MVTRRNLIGQVGAAAGGVAAGALLSARPAWAEAKSDAKPQGAWFNVLDYGAVGDGQANNTQSFAKAIAAAAAAGGGVVYFPNGKFVSGTIALRDNITLHFAEGCAILGSADKADYTGFMPDPKAADYNGFTTERNNRNAPRELALIFGEKVKNIAITGRGAICGRGANFPKKNNAGGRPFLVKLMECQDVLIEGCRFSESAAWGIHLKKCERVCVRGIHVFNHVNANNDGIDIDCCKDLAVMQSVFDTDDDAICLKSESLQRCENIMISDCVASSHCNAIKTGTGSQGGFVNLTITNCTVVSPRYSKHFNGDDRGISGVSLEIVDGGEMDRVTVSNIAIDGVTVPLFLRLGDRNRARGVAGTMKNIVISNIVATNCSPLGSPISGVPGQMIENVTLSNISLGYEGGGKAESAAQAVPEREKAYPEAKMFKALPAWGLYCRHVRGLKLHNVTLQTAAPDARHAAAFDDVRGLDIDGFDAPHAPGAAPLMKLTQSGAATIRGCRPVVEGGVFLKLEGKETGGIALLANDLRQAGKVVEASEEVARDAVAQTGNLGA